MNQYLLVKGTAGLGNRVFVLVTAILYARMCDRTLVVDWSDDFYTNHSGNAKNTPTQNVFSTLFELKNTPHAPSVPEDVLAEGSVYPALWKPVLDLSIDDVVASDGQLVKAMGQGIFRKYACNVKHLTYPEDLLIASGYDEEIEALRSLFQGEYAHFKNLDKAAIFHETYQRYLTLAPPVQQRLDDFRSAHMAGKSWIGIHIRKSDKAISYAWYQKALAEHVERYPEAHIFLATDNRDVEREISELYPDNVLVLDKWLPEPGVAVHGNTDCPDLGEHAVTALLDICLLASCDYLIYSRTTSFGRLASYISDRPVARHFDIQQYNDQRRRTWHERLQTLRNKVNRKASYGVGWLKLRGILPSG
ncbi:MAG: nodulation protein NodZ [Cyanobacteria bacterium J06607_13]